MKIVGITGGVGSGKSTILDALNDLCTCYIIRADELAKSLEVKGEVCYKPLVELLGSDILDEDEEINPRKMAKAIFEANKDDYLLKVNEIIHPQVKIRIKSLIEEHKKKGDVDYFFIEAALLIEDHYDLICDEMWYVYASKDIRRLRLKNSRGYTDEKIDSIFQSQLDDETFRKYCKYIVDNGGSQEYAKQQLVKILEEERV